MLHSARAIRISSPKMKTSFRELTMKYFNKQPATATAQYKYGLTSFSKLFFM